MLRQTQQLKQQQKLSVQQIQLMKLLQVTTAALEERVKEEMDENPALEFAEEKEQSNEDHLNEVLSNEKEETEGNDTEEISNNEEINIEEYLHNDDQDYGDGNSYNNDESERYENPIKLENSLYDYLENQVGMLNLQPLEEAIALQIIGSIDEDGYLTREVSAMLDDLAFGQNIISTEIEIKKIIAQVQNFDPPGICAQNLQECLLLQLKRIFPQTETIKIAIKILSSYYDEFIRKHYSKIVNSLKIDEEQLKEVIKIITNLQPKPGAPFTIVNKAENFIVPDFYIFNENGVLELNLNSRNAPDLKISADYRDMLRAYDQGDKKDRQQRDAVSFIKQKLDSAKWFIDAIKQRQQTLYQTMNTIINQQKEFFLTGDVSTLKPMVLKDVADVIDLDVSTISRVVNSKFVQTEFGTFKLKYFFSEGLKNDVGEEFSTKEVKSIIQELVDNEDKTNPLKDEELTTELEKRGFIMARRTVAKYREQLNITVARLRKKI